MTLIGQEKTLMIFAYITLSFLVALLGPDALLYAPLCSRHVADAGPEGPEVNTYS
jgi:hypothetical protein